MSDNKKKKTDGPPLQVVYKSVDELVSDPANVRKHPEKNLDSIRGSLRRFGFQKPIVVDSKGVVRAGNGTLEAAKLEGLQSIPCVVSDLDDVDLTAFAIADNRTAELAEWDFDSLDDALAGLHEIGFDLEDIGFSPDDLDGLFEDEDGTHGDDDPDVGIPEGFQILIHCENEQQQVELLEQFAKDGLKCKALIS
ncbi:ParB N-terminal domain-containing protein [bacterium]|nr:ParB N-terminal domain-containing protein [bacterium]